MGLYAFFVLGTGALGWFLSKKYGTTGRAPKWARRFKLHGARWRKVQHALATLRTAIAGIRHMRLGMTALALLASVLHICLRIAILPAIVYSLGETHVPLAPLVLWPVALMWGSALAPLPGGGGAIEVGFKAALGHAIPARIFGAALVWWRFYTFYLFILLGALAAGNTVLRALRDERGGSRRRRRGGYGVAPKSARFTRWSSACDTAPRSVRVRPVESDQVMVLTADALSRACAID